MAHTERHGSRSRKRKTALVGFLLVPLVAGLMVGQGQAQGGNAEGSSGSKLARDLSAALEQFAGTGEEAESRLEQAVGTRPELLPLLVSHFNDPKKGLLAVTHAGHLHGADHEILAAGIAATRRTDHEFTDRAGQALSAQVPAAAADQACRAWRRASSLTLRLAAIGATRVTRDHAADIAQINLRSKNTQEALRATGWLLAAPDVGSALLLDLLIYGPDPHLGEVVSLVAADRQLVVRAARVKVSAPRRQAILAELLCLSPGPGVDLWLGHLTGVTGPEVRAAVLPRLIIDRSLEPYLLEAARRHAVAEHPDLALPATGKSLLSGEDVLKLAVQARPAHVPYLLANIDRVPWPERARVAVSLARFSHPEGLATLRRGSRHLARGTRQAVALAIIAHELPAGDVLIHLLHDRDPGVALAAQAGIERLKVILDLDVVLPLLASQSGPPPHLLLAALQRGPDLASRWQGVINAVGAGQVAHVDAVARWLFFVGPGRHPAVVRATLAHERAEMRARALEAFGTGARVAEASPRELLEMVEGLARDSEAVVRVHAARALGSIQSDLARAVLVGLAVDPEPMVRDEALRGLARQGPYHVIPILRRALRDPDPWVVNAACLGLFTLARYDQVLPLLDDIDDPILGLRTRRVLAATLGMVSGDRADYLKALDRQIPGWDRNR